jgi:hypothetical protein
MHHVHIVFSCTYQLHKLKQITKNSEKKETYTYSFNPTQPIDHAGKLD